MLAPIKMNEEFSDLPKPAFVISRDFPMERFALRPSFLKLFHFLLGKKKKVLDFFVYRRVTSAVRLCRVFNAILWSLFQCHRFWELGVRGMKKSGNRKKNLKKAINLSELWYQVFQMQITLLPFLSLQNEKLFQIWRKEKTKPLPTKVPCHHYWKTFNAEMFRGEPLL